MDKSVENIAKDLLSESKPLVPIDTYALQESGVVVKEKENYRLVRYEAFSPLGYNYALIQHENLFFNHPRGGQAKYLQQPFEQNINNYVKNMKDDIKKVIK